VTDPTPEALQAATYERIPTCIQAVEFQPHIRPWPLNVRSRSSLSDNDWFVWNELHKSEINVRPGDMIRVDDPNDTYPIDPAKFAETYRRPAAAHKSEEGT
jgi:hypothetical protein